jgi:cysteinyl-tRNA synthetase
MSRSLGNVFLPVELFTGMKLAEDSPSATPSQAKLSGKHPLFEKAYSPTVVRFFMMQTHYRSTLDFGDDALQAAEKAYNRIMDSYKTLQTLPPSASSSEDIAKLERACYDAMNDDFNTPVLIAQLFDAVRIVNLVNDKKSTLTQADLDRLKKIYQHFVFDIMGLKQEEENSKTSDSLDKVMQLVLDMRAKAKANKDFAASDEIRNKLAEAGIQIKDSKEGATWTVN